MEWGVGFEEGPETMMASEEAIKIQALTEVLKHMGCT